MDPCVIDQVLVIHSRRAGRHAGKTGQTAINVFHDQVRRRSVVLQHVFYQINPTPRTIQLIAKQHIGGTGRYTKSTVYTAAQNLFRFINIRIRELGERETGLHPQISLYILPGFRIPFGSKACLRLRVNRATGVGSG